MYTKEMIAWGVQAALKERSRIERRERIAKEVMGGFAADPNVAEESVELLARYAVRWADALIAELDKGGK